MHHGIVVVNISLYNFMCLYILYIYFFFLENCWFKYLWINYLNNKLKWNLKKMVVYTKANRDCCFRYESAFFFFFRPYREKYKFLSHQPSCRLDYRFILMALVMYYVALSVIFPLVLRLMFGFALCCAME